MRKAALTAEIIELPNAIPMQKWAGRIKAAWREQLPSIFETGNLLEVAKAELKHGEWLKMIKEELPFGSKTALRLIIVANDDKLRDGAHAHHLPVSWMTLYELTKLTAEQFDVGIESGTINPKMERKDVKGLRDRENTTKKRGRISKSSIDPVDRCVTRVRALILEWLPAIPSDKHAILLTDLRSEIDSIEQIIEKQTRE